MFTLSSSVDSESHHLEMLRTKTKTAFGNYGNSLTLDGTVEQNIVVVQFYMLQTGKSRQFRVTLKLLWWYECVFNSLAATVIESRLDRAEQTATIPQSGDENTGLHRLNCVDPSLRAASANMAGSASLHTGPKSCGISADIRNTKPSRAVRFTPSASVRTGIRCHFVHNNEEEKKHSISRSSSSSSSSSSSIPQQPPIFSRSHRPPLVRQSFSFAGFPSAPQQPAAPALPATASFTRAPSASPPSCADITDLLSHAFLEMDSAFEASPAHQYQPPIGQASTADPCSPFLPSPDSGCSPCGRSPTASPSLRQSPGASGVFSGPLGARSLSYTSLSDQDQDGSSSASSLSGSECCGGINEANGRRLAVFSQLSVPEDATGFCL
ncbi:hypothetical protein D9C73_015224 [Collichthys lucidus]|uniref:Uncharacterized protein n=1 Tax=Collichthys lucidus TaxID=240159 RepID=A0A4U5V1X0_COLLU|nr:hypothetical protein D9C73_015224 [Collichthys lucidus]